MDRCHLYNTVWHCCSGCPHLCKRHRRSRREANTRRGGADKDRSAGPGVIDQFSTAVGNLESSTLTSRLNGIYELQIIMRHSRSEQPEIIQVISNFIRNSKSQQSKGQQRAGQGRIEPTADTQAALTFLADRNTSYDGGATIDLHGANLDGAQLPYAKLAHANLRDARLYGANLTGADLNHSKLAHADLRRSHLNDASLVFADLTRADLSDTSLGATNLTKATMIRTDLSGAQLVYYPVGPMAGPAPANLTDAYMPFANLEQADVSWANFYHAFLSGARFVHTTAYNAHFRDAYLGARRAYVQYNVDCTIPPADLSRANMENADFYGANLNNVALNPANFRHADLLNADRRHVAMPSIPCSDQELRAFNPNE